MNNCEAMEAPTQQQVEEKGAIHRTIIVKQLFQQDTRRMELPRGIN